MPDLPSAEDVFGPHPDTLPSAEEAFGAAPSAWSLDEADHHFRLLFGSMLEGAAGLWGLPGDLTKGVTSIAGEPGVLAKNVPSENWLGFEPAMASEAGIAHFKEQMGLGEQEVHEYKLPETHEMLGAAHSLVNTPEPRDFKERMIQQAGRSLGFVLAGGGFLAPEILPAAAMGGAGGQAGAELTGGSKVGELAGSLIAGGLPSGLWSLGRNLAAAGPQMTRNVAQHVVGGGLLGEAAMGALGHTVDPLWAGLIGAAGGVVLPPVARAIGRTITDPNIYRNALIGGVAAYPQRVEEEQFQQGQQARADQEAQIARQSGFYQY